MTKQDLIIPHRIIYSAWDFQQALSALTFLFDECDFNAKYSHIQLRKFRCYETTAIISFSRPFKTGRGRKELSLEEIDCQLTEDENSLKDKLLRLRDKVIGHSDEEEMLYKSYSLKPFDDSNIRVPIAVFYELLYLTEAELDAFEALLRKLIRAIVDFKVKLAQSNPEMFEHYMQPSSNH